MIYLVLSTQENFDFNLYAMKKYRVTWGEGQSQGNLSKTEALKIAGDLLKIYDFVSIKKD